MRRFLTMPVTAITAVGVFLWAICCDTFVDQAQRHHYGPEIAIAVFLAIPLAYGILRLQMAPLDGATKTSAAFAFFLGILLLLDEVIGPFTIGVERWSQLIGAIASAACLVFGWRNLQMLRTVRDA